VLFGSRPKAILAHPEDEPRVNKGGFARSSCFAKNPSTIYAGMHEVRPGQIVRVSQRRATSGATGSSPRVVTRRFATRRSGQVARELLEDTAQRQNRQRRSALQPALRRARFLDRDGDGAPGDSSGQNGKQAALGSYGRFCRARGKLRSGRVHKTVDTRSCGISSPITGCDHSEDRARQPGARDRELGPPLPVMRASDFPLIISGDMFASLNRLFQAVREEFDRALSGESADEIFRRLYLFHDPKAIEAATFPWLATTGQRLRRHAGLDADLLRELNLPEFQADSYAQAVAETPILHGRRSRRAADAGDQLSPPDALRAVPARPQRTA